MKKLLYIIVLIINCQLSIVESQWVQQTVPVSKPIKGIKFINANTGWACTDKGTSGLNYGYILSTSNGGTTWVIQDSSVSTDYNALSVINNNIVYAGGDSVGFGKLAKTINGGVNWTYITLPGNMLIDDMQFLNKDSGWACIDLFGADVRTTTNGGLNWIVRTNGMAAQTQKIFFLNYSTGFCGANFFLYKTTNAGLNWIQLANFQRSPTSIFFFNENTGWIGATISTIYKTTNGGVNWDTITLGPLFGSITDLQFLSPTLAYGGNRSLRLLISTNGGLNWGYQTNTTASYKISFSDTLTGWIGDNGISKTTNGGGIIIPVGLQNITQHMPIKYNLYQNYPNPFNPETNIKFDIYRSESVKLLVFDVLGKTIAELVNEKLNAGSYEYKFTADNLPSGVYFYKLITGGYTETKKMVLVK